MKYVFLSLALLLTLALFACGQSPSGQGGTVAVVDMNTLQSKSRIILEVSAHLETLKQSLLNEALATEQAYQNDPTPENDQIRQQAVAGLQEAFGQAQQDLFTELRATMDDILEKYRVEHGLSVIVLKETVLAMDPDVDVTDDILAAFDAVTLDLEALAPIPEAEPQAMSQTEPEAQAEAAPETEPETAPETETGQQ